MENKKSNLDPWRILLSHLMKMGDSYAIPGIIDRTGMVINWSMPENERTYTKYRIDTFRSRITAAYESLPPEDQLRVSHAIATELSTFKGIENVKSDLKRIGWNIEDGSLIPVDADVTELFFPKSTIHDAYVKVREILDKASSSIYVIDPWIDKSIFIVLKTISHTPIKVKLLSAHYPSDFIHETKTFITQHTGYSIEIRNTNDFHDRFLVIDETICWHIGASIKDAGKKSFMINLIEDNGNRAALIKQFEDSWNAAQVQNI
jgi:hypothetical protein